MVLASPNPIRSTERVLLPSDLIPIVDLKAERSEVKKLIVRACEEYGFFKVVNHGISDETIAKMEEAGFGFFAKPMAQKKLAAPAYGCKNIGFNGDIGEVEYLLLSAPTSSSIAQISKTISNIDPSNFRYVTNVHSLLCFFFSYSICHYPTQSFTFIIICSIGKKLFLFLLLLCFGLKNSIISMI